ncbi:MAG: sigma 54-interacting transcriptional regulator, partial [Pseudomonadota bacterium]
AKLLRTVERALDTSRKPAPAAKTQLPSLIAPVGRSRLMKDLREYVQKLSSLDSPVLFIGEPGSGRSAFASYLHSLSDRAAGPMVTLLAASLTDDNVEEMLFGSESGDEIHTGYFERAESGTLLIDELTDLSENAQKLVQSAIDQGHFRRRGGTTPIELRARVVATVAANFEALIEAGRLRRDLISSLSTLTVRVPPLRDYAEDVPELLGYYVDRLVDTDGASFRRFSVAAQNRLRNYPWPDNVRELKNLVQRLLLTGDEEEIPLEEVEREVSATAATDEPLVKQDLLSLPLREAREQFERAYLQQQLVLCDGKVGKLAARVGMERTHLYRKLRSLGVDFRSVASDD